MGRKGKRVHEQSAGSSTPAGDYETIRLIPAQKQDAKGTGSSLPSGISAPPGLDPPESGADTTKLAGPYTCPLRQKKKLLLNRCSEMIWCSKLWAAKSLTCLDTG